MSDLRIEFSGDKADCIAERITATLQSDLPSTMDLKTEVLRDSEDHLGMAEIVITMVVLSLGKSLVLTLLDDLEKYFLEEYDKTPVKIQLHIKKDVHSTGRRVGTQFPGIGHVAIRTLVSSARDMLSKF